MHNFFLRLFILVGLFLLIFSGRQDGFSINKIDDATMSRMEGRSFPRGCVIKRDDLRYLKVRYCDAEGRTKQGELVCNKAIAQDLIDIFEALLEARYPIERMTLIDEYAGDDEASMTANNTSCFNYRTVKGSKRLSKHAQGLAIDINPLYNPCVKVRRGKQIVQPKCANEWLKNRTKSHNKLIITSDDLCYKLFRQHGFRWGGSWKSMKDYQHFEK